MQRRHFVCQAAVLGETGELVWGRSSGSSSWPAVIRKGRGEHGVVTVEWYGQRTSTAVS